MQQRTPWLLLVGLLSSFIVASVVLVNAFLHPFNTSTADILWAAIYAVLFLLVILLGVTKQYKALVLGTFVTLFLLLGIILVFSDNGPALLALAWITLLAASLGDWFLRRVHLSAPDRPFENILLGAAVGIAGLSIVPLLLSSPRLFESILPLPQVFFRLLHPVPTFLLLVLASILFIPRFFRVYSGSFSRFITTEWRKFQNNGYTANSLILPVLAICAVGPFLWALSPTIRGDGYIYHLSAPAFYIQNRGIIELTEPLQFYWAHYGEMLFTLAMLITDQPLPALIHFLTAALTAGLTYTLAKRIAGKPVALLAVLLYASLPILYDAGTAHNDFIVALFALGMIYAGYNWWEEQNSNWLMLSGFFAGMALGTKFNAGLVIPPIALLIVIGSLKSSRRIPDLVVNLVKFGVPCLLFFAPWAILNWVWIGNPFYPYLGSLFTRSISALSETETSTSGRSIGAYLLQAVRLPWDLTVRNGESYIDNSGGILAGLPLFAIPWMIASYSSLSSKVRQYYRSGILVIAIAFLIYPLFANRLRYLIPIFPVLCIIASVNFYSLSAALSKHLSKTAFVGLLAASAFVYLVFTRAIFTTTGWQIPERVPYGVALGLETPADFLSRTLPAYDALQYLNKQGDGDHKIASLGVEARAYSNSILHSLYYSDVLPPILKSSHSIDEFVQNLQANDFDYIIIDRTEIEDEPEKYNAPFLIDLFKNKAAELVFARNDIYVYNLRLANDPVVSRHNLLENGGFETAFDDQGQVSWETYGAPTVNSDITAAHTGNASVLVTGDAALNQFITVEPGKLYTLSEWARADQDKQEGRLQIMWLNQQRLPILVSIDVIPLTQTWAEYQMSITAPEGAAFARVYINAHAGSQVRYDDICFAQGDSCAP